MEYLVEFLRNLWMLSNDMALYIIFGVLFAGVLKQIVPKDFVSRHLGKSSVASVIKAALFGIPLPLCSCSVIPFATTLKKEGASSGSVLSFLIATPITGVDSILATYGFFGWFFTLYRVASSFVIAIVAGVLQNFFEKEEPVQTEALCSGCGCSIECADEKSKRFSWKKVYEYALFDVFADFAKPLFWGLVAGALLSTFLPKELADLLEGQLFATYMLVLFIALPMYVCATASLPVAAGLIAAGITPGAAFILLSAGPATNSVTMGVVLQTLGKRALVIYLTVIGLLSLLFGYGLDLVLSTVELQQRLQTHHGASYADALASVVMFAAIFYFLFFAKKSNGECHVDG